jgi:lysophospholipase
VIAKAAPFHADVADAPEGGVCRWLTTADGVRLRACFWREGGRGTVLLFSGRTEYAEKYGPAARELAVRGFAMATIDWRGQGLSARLSGDATLGHVEHLPPEHEQRLWPWRVPKACPNPIT